MKKRNIQLIDMNREVKVYQTGASSILVNSQYSHGNEYVAQPTREQELCAFPTSDW